MVKKRVSFTASGRRVIFYAKPASKRRRQTSRTSTRTSSRRSYRIRRDTEKLIEAGLPFIHPALPLVKAGAQLMKDMLHT
jgi:hypothetical protein